MAKRGKPTKKGTADKPAKSNSVPDNKRSKKKRADTDKEVRPPG